MYVFNNTDHQYCVKVFFCKVVRYTLLLFEFKNNKCSTYRVYGIQTIVKHIRHMNLEKQTTYYRSKMQF